LQACGPLTSTVKAFGFTRATLGAARLLHPPDKAPAGLVQADVVTAAITLLEVNVHSTTTVRVPAAGH
jgi:hypothetical protein